MYVDLNLSSTQKPGTLLCTFLLLTNKSRYGENIESME